MNHNSILSGDFSEQQWVDQISKNFDDEGHDDVSDVPVCVFSVPKATTRFKPEAYAPLAIALGPYHHFETRLYQMERFKVAAVKAILTPDQVLTFESLVIKRLIENQPMTRACYHKYIDLYDDTLAWIFAIDGLFLIGLFTHYVDISTLMPKKLINNGVLYRDIMVLENQLPLCLLDEIWQALHLSSSSHDQNGDNELISMMRKFCEVHSPLKLAKDFNYRVETTTRYLHLLDLMHHLIVNNQDAAPQPPQVEILLFSNNNDDITIVKEDKLTENVERDHPIKVIKNITWEKISNLLGLEISQQVKEDEDDDDLRILTEIDVPSVTSLSKHAQIDFCYTNGGIKDVKFDKNKGILYLPILTLHDYSEVMLRNLLAYEVAARSRSMREIARYIDLMSGIVDTKEDVKLLRDVGIIRGSMNDKEIVDMLNGMNKSGGGKYIISGNKTVEQVKEYYNNRPMMKLCGLVKKDLVFSKKVASVVFTIFASLLMMLYSFCEVYGCSRLHKGGSN
ncbi:hypothetical protein QVD17_26333 [Tagetes erecta]|uniref:Uncharacterized protein n=1 Tax=Tagetes erecta TaxID=13708 RepID=A0AAD8K7A2_TARER|nr:hypothetical protein QVD17_26333 [Tagetes erecta]